MPSSFRMATEIVIHLDDGDIRDHVLRPNRVQAGARFRIEPLQHLDVFTQRCERQTEPPRQVGQLMILEQPEMLADDGLTWRADQAQPVNLQQQAFLQVACRDAGRIECLDQRKCLLHFIRRPGTHRSQFLDRRDQIPVLVQVADDRQPDFPQTVVIGLHEKLPPKVVRQ